MIDAVLILDKPSGMTSHDVVNRVRRITRERSVGHLGTLDPMATGVLPLVMGRYTRLAQFFKEGVKTYEGTIRFGFATDTYDAEGEAVGEVCEAHPTREELEQHLGHLRGVIQQTPPSYSAKKINGVAAYKLARRDQPVELKPVEVEVRRFEITAVEGERASFVVEVSAGTYVRSLAHDLGAMLGCGAHLAELRRTEAGEFSIQQALTLEQLAAEYEGNGRTKSASSQSLSEYALSDVESAEQSNQVSKNLRAKSFSLSSSFLNKGIDALNYRMLPFLKARSFLLHMPVLIASETQSRDIGNGRHVRLSEFSDAPLVKVFSPHEPERLIAVCERIAGPLFRPRVVLPI
ncbi:MAG: tRNA pseudouridine(55) synthase TruB [Terracidiphilus sp.]|nr:tRNA pseudouridine(55) synthase TruB [Terracidiphilus sp.]